MPRDSSIRSILLIGSGPIVIGQACEFDYAGTQALRALKAEGYRVILVNSNPATIMTDPSGADRVYIEPLTPAIIESIIEREKPDALLPTMGGQTALNLAVQLAERGVLARHGVRMLGASLESIRIAEDRQRFKETMLRLGIDVPRSRQVTGVEEGIEFLREIGLPAVLRPSFTLGGEGGGLACDEGQFRQVLEHGLFLSPAHSVLVEESVAGWKEFELEVVRDRADNVIVVCSIENVDPMGIHTGDSITVAPAQTLTNRQYQVMREMAKAIIRAVNVETGGSNIQFAVKPDGPGAGRIVAIEMNPRVSRSSALASKATGFPIAKVAARLAVGYTLDELRNDITASTPASFEPAIDYVVTKIPRFDFEKFPTTSPLLGTQMKSVGEVMAIGRNFKESLLKAVAGIEQGSGRLHPTDCDDPEVPLEALEEKLAQPKPNRLWYVATAIRRSVPVARIAGLTRIDPWFIEQLREVVELEARLHKPLADWSGQELAAAKRFGILDRDIAGFSGAGEEMVRQARLRHGVTGLFSQVDTCAGEFVAATPYHYSTYDRGASERPAPAPGERGGIVILGSGPNRIGQGIEFDYCCVHASEAFKEEGRESIMVNCNPETVSTDHDVSSQLYFEPLTSEHVLEVIRGSRDAAGAVAQFGGQTPLKLSGVLHGQKIRLLGTQYESIDLAEDRQKFAAMIKTLGRQGLKHAPNATAHNLEEALHAGERLGYPLLLRPSYVLGGRGMKIATDESDLIRCLSEAIEVSESHPLLIDHFLEGATEVEVDAVSDGEQVLIGAVMEQVEEAGVHSGDSTCVIPPRTLSPERTEEIRRQSRLLARELKTLGLINIQFAVKDGEIYVLEVNPRASRTVPYVSKTVGAPLAKLAARVLLGKKLADLGYRGDFDAGLKRWTVKMPVFPFRRFPGVDFALGPEMRSTGEVMGSGACFAEAYAKAWLGTGHELPGKGRALISVLDEHKRSATEIARALVATGFELDATEGTADWLKRHGLAASMVPKAGHGSPDCVALLHQGRYQLVLCTALPGVREGTGYFLRRAALDRDVPLCTLLTQARALCEAIAWARDNRLEARPLD